MPENNRLFALSSTATTPWSEPTDGPALLINDAAVALRWYLTHERERVLDVTIQGSSDDGETWQALAPHELRAEAERALTPAMPNTAAVQQLLDLAAAEWLDDRIRFVPPAAPHRGRQYTPYPARLQRGGHIWAMTMGTVPSNRVLARLENLYADPPDPFREHMRAAAQATLDTLALAQHPAAVDRPALLRAARHVDRLRSEERSARSAAGPRPGSARFSTIWSATFLKLPLSSATSPTLNTPRSRRPATMRCKWH